MLLRCELNGSKGSNLPPAQKPGVPIMSHYDSKLHYVPILSQPESRELPNFWWSMQPVDRFQSSPSPKAGSYMLGLRL
jgi:hypothetical protein